MLPGISSIAGFVGGTGSEWEFVGSESATGANQVPIHASAEAGDIAICLEYSVDTAASVSIPAGWTEIGKLVSTYGYAFYYKVLEPGDLASSFGATANSSYQGEKLMIIVRNEDVDTPVANEFVVTTLGGGAPADQTITASNQSSPCCVVGVAMARTNAGGGSLDTSFDNSPAFDETLQGANTNPCITAGLKFFGNSSPSDMVVSMGDAGFGNGLAGFTIS